MIKLTQESVGKVLLSGYKQKHTIFAKVPITEHNNLQRYMGITPCGIIRTFLSDGRRIEGISYHHDNNTTLVSLHTPVRPIEEVMADMANELEFYVNDEPVQSATTRVKALLAEAQTLGVVE